MRLVAVCLFLSIATAHAQDLVPTSEDESGSLSFFIKKDRIRVDGPYVTFWMYTFTKKPMPVYTNRQQPVFSSTIGFMKAQCAEGTYAASDLTYYDSKGNVLASTPGSEYVFRRLIPGSHSEFAARRACELAGRSLN